jgi:glycosyltransferase involved in cell wall biosynthesis
MSRRKKRWQESTPAGSSTPGQEAKGLRGRYEEARRLAEEGGHDEARPLYEAVKATAGDRALKALACNDLAVFAAVEGNEEAARRGFEEALQFDPGCTLAGHNLLVLTQPAPPLTVTAPDAPLTLVSPPSGLPATQEPPSRAAAVPSDARRTRIAILSFLFNWPTTGGGNIHTAELALFLGRAGYEVRHYYARYPAWGIGGVANTPFPSQALEFDEASWDLATIQSRYRQAVDSFAPDWVVVTDSWNMKPLLAEAVRGYRTILRLQGMECLCPLNNVRLLADSTGQVRQCRKHQLATPEDCSQCLAERGQHSGGLHKAERALSGAGTPGYAERLRRAFREAEAVLVVNPLTETLVDPFAERVHVVTAGMDPDRFPWPWPHEEPRDRSANITRLFFAGLVEEWMKGYHILQQACELVWRRRQDFELVATGEPAGRINAFTRYVGWLDQDTLPRHLRAADVLVMPTIAQEGLGRTAVEAMAVGRPVVASRIGGLPATVLDGVTGLLCEPGSAEDLASKIETLLDDAALRERLGQAGRRRFEEHYRWDVIIQRHYVPLLGPPLRGPAGTAESVEPQVVVHNVRREVPAEHRRLFEAHPWPASKPSVPIPAQNLGWLEDGARELLARELSSQTRLVVEVGAWLGLSTRHIADHAPNATVVTIDHWKGNPEHQRRPEWQAMLPSLRETFLALSWDYRQRILPLSMSSREGLRTVSAHGLEPEVIFLDSEHSYAGMNCDLDLCLRLFPRATLLGDDYDDPEVCKAVGDFARLHQMRVETAGSRWRAWKLVRPS